MGEPYINLSSFKFPSECPSCGSKRFVITVSKKIVYEDVYDVSSGEPKRISSEVDDVEYEVVIDISCDKCNEDLNELVGLS